MTIRHNDLRDLTANISHQVCNDIETDHVNYLLLTKTCMINQVPLEREKMADVSASEEYQNSRQNKDEDRFEGTPHVNNLLRTPMIAEININDEICIYNGNNENDTTLSIMENEIDESYDQVILLMEERDKAKTKTNITETIKNITRQSSIEEEEEPKDKSNISSLNESKAENFMEADYIEFKHFVTNEMSILKQAIENIDFNLIFSEQNGKKILENENKNLKKEVLDLRQMVNDLVNRVCEKNFEISEEDAVIRRNHPSGTIKTNVYKKTLEINDITIKNNLEKWLIPKRTLSQKNISVNSKINEIELKNKYDVLYTKDNYEQNYDAIIEKNHTNTTMENITKRKHKRSENNITKQRRPAVVTNKNPENDHGYEKVRVVPGQKLYSEALGSKETRKIKIFSDSIPKSINMREFNRLCMNGKSQLKSFPGATARQLNHYIVPTLEEEDKPDVVIIHVGINDLLKKKGKQSEDEIDNTAMK